MPDATPRNAKPQPIAFEASLEIHVIPESVARARDLQRTLATALSTVLAEGATLDRCDLWTGVPAAHRADPDFGARATEALRREGFPIRIHDAFGRAFEIEAVMELDCSAMGGESC